MDDCGDQVEDIVIISDNTFTICAPSPDILDRENSKKFAITSLQQQQHHHENLELNQIKIEDPEKTALIDENKKLHERNFTLFEKNQDLSGQLRELHQENKILLAAKTHEDCEKEKKHLEAMYAEEDRAVYGLSIPWDLLETISILPTTLDPVEKLREFICSAKLNAAEHANAKKAIEVYENEKAQRWNEMERERERNKDEQIASRTTPLKRNRQQEGIDKSNQKKQCMAPKKELKTDGEAVLIMPEQKHAIKQNHVQSVSKVKKDNEKNDHSKELERPFEGIQPASNVKKDDENNYSKELGITGILKLKNLDHQEIIIPSFRRVDRSADKCNCPLKKRDGILRSSSKHEDQWSEIIKLHSEREAREKLRFQPVCPGRYRNIDWLL